MTQETKICPDCGSEVKNLGAHKRFCKGIKKEIVSQDMSKESTPTPQKAGTWIDELREPTQPNEDIPTGDEPVDDNIPPTSQIQSMRESMFPTQKGSEKTSFMIAIGDMEIRLETNELPVGNIVGTVLEVFERVINMQAMQGQEIEEPQPIDTQGEPEQTDASKDISEFDINTTHRKTDPDGQKEFEKLMNSAGGC